MHPTTVRKRCVVSSMTALALFCIPACGNDSGLAGGGNRKSVNQKAAASTDNPSAAPADTGNDEFSNRLKEKGAQTGAIQVSLMWDNTNDLDLHVVTPTGEHLFFGQKNDSKGGYLDIDMNAYEISNKPVENVFWKDSATHGVYKVYVHHYGNKGSDLTTSFRVRIKNGSKVEDASGSATFTGDGGSGGDGYSYPSGSSGDSNYSNYSSSDYGLDEAVSSTIPDSAVLVREFTY